MLRRFHRPLFLIALALCVAAPAKTARAAQNLLVNPSFEEPLAGHPWMPAGWDTSVTGLPTSFFGRDTLLAHDGHWAVSTASASVRLPMAHNWAQTLIADPSWWGKDLVFSVWTRSIGVRGRGYVLLQAYRDTVTKMATIWGIPREDALDRLRIAQVDDPLIDLGWKRAFFDDPETDWVKREVRVFVPPTTNMVYVRAGLYGLGQLYIDDASLTLEPAQAPEPLAVGQNLLADPDFEEGGTAWELSLPPFPDFDIGLVEGIASSGSHSYRFMGGSGMAQGKTGLCQVFANRNFAGKRLRLSGDIKTDTLRSLASVQIYCHTLHGVEQATSVERPSGTQPWTRVSIEIDAPDDTYEVWAWFSYSGPAPGVIYFDNASLEVLGPVKGGGKTSKR